MYQYADIALSGDNQFIYDGDAIAQSIYALLKTHRGEVLFDCEYGNEIENYLWSELSEHNALLLDGEIRRTIQQDSRCEIQDLKVTIDSVNNAYKAQVLILVNGEIQSLDFLFKVK